MLKLKAAVFAPYPYWRLIVAVGVGPTILVASVSRDFMILAGVATVLLKIFIFGRILSRVLPDRVSTFRGRKRARRRRVQFFRRGWQPCGARLR